MARGDTAAPARRRFDESDDAPADIAPRRVEYRCWAEQCPMPGTIFLSSNGVCAWHFGHTGDAVKRVTQSLLDWQCVQAEISVGRRALIDPATLASPKAQDDALREAWARVAPAVLGSGWKPRIEPRRDERLGEWVRRLERFLSNRVKEALKPGTAIADDDAQTPLVQKMQKSVRGGLPSPDGDWA